jgi:hypothetical protein
VIDPRTKPASLPERRNEFDVRHFSPRSRANPIGRQPRCPCTAMGRRLSALDLSRLGITRGPWRFGFGKTFIFSTARPTNEPHGAPFPSKKTSFCPAANSLGSELTPSSPPIRNGVNSTTENNARGTTMIRRSGRES